MFGLGVGELLLVLVVLAVLFSRRLPDLGHSLGKSISKFRKALRESDEIDVTTKEESEKKEQPPRAS